MKQWLKRDNFTKQFHWWSPQTPLSPVNALLELGELQESSGDIHGTLGGISEETSTAQVRVEVTGGPFSMTLHSTHSSTTVCDFKPYIIALMYQYILEWTKCVWTFNLNQPTKNTKLFKKK